MALLGVGIRLATLRLSIALAERARVRREKLAAIEPELQKLRERFAADSDRLATEIVAAQRRAGIGPVDGRALLGGLVQLPLFAAVYNAVRRAISVGQRFLWIRDLSQPDFLLTAGVTGLAVLASVLAPNVAAQAKWISIVLPAALAAVFLWHAASGLAIYWGASSVVAIGQVGWQRWSSGSVRSLRGR